MSLNYKGSQIINITTIDKSSFIKLIFTDKKKFVKTIITNMYFYYLINR